MKHLGRRSLQITYVLLAASLVLIGPALAGFGGSIGLAGVATGLGVGLYLLREQLAEVEPRFGYDPRPYLRVTWAAPPVAAVVILLGLGSSPAELQALGGVVGLAGMANYFLRPIYFLLAALLGIDGSDHDTA